MMQNAAKCTIFLENFYSSLVSVLFIEHKLTRIIMNISLYIY